MKQAYKCDELTLSAYIDGELDAASMREVDLLLEKDADARQYVLDAVRATALLRSEMNVILHEEVPDRLLAKLNLQPAIKSRRSAIVSQMLKMAAALLIAALGLGGGMLLERNVGGHLPDEIAPIPARYRSVVNAALEYNLSGTSRKWREPDAPILITVTPVKTYRDKNGVYYREFHLEVATAEKQNRINGLAYRAGNGQWKTKALFF